MIKPSDTLARALLDRLNGRLGTKVGAPFAPDTIRLCGQRFRRSGEEGDRAFFQFCFKGWLSRELGAGPDPRSTEQWLALQERARTLLETSSSLSGIAAWEWMNGVPADDLWARVQEVESEPLPPIAARPPLASGEQLERVPLGKFIGLVGAWLQRWGALTDFDAEGGRMTLAHGALVRWQLDAALDRSSAHLDGAGPVMRIATTEKRPFEAVPGFLHELGHALFFASVDPAEPLEFQAYGDPAVHEGFAFLFERLSQCDRWWSSLSDDTLGPVEAYAGARRRLLVTRFGEAHGVLIELAFWGHEPSLAHPSVAKPGLWNALNGSVRTFQWSDYLRGMRFAEEAEELLRAKYDLNWFSDPRALAALQALWSVGTRHRAPQHLDALRAVQ